MNNPVIVVHYHELWLKGRNRRFFLGKLFTALRKALEGVPVQRIEQPGDRFIVRLGDGASLEEATARVSRVLGIAFYAVAKPVEREYGRSVSSGMGRSGAVAICEFRGAGQAQR